MFLKTFLYLDTDAMEDYLSTLQGYVLNGNVEETTSDTSEGGGGIKLGPVQGGLSKGKQKETRQTLQINPAAQFETLYEQLNENKLLVSKNEIKIDQLECGQLIELQLDLEIPPLYKFLSVVDNLSSLMEIIANMDQTVTYDTATTDALRQISALTTQKSIPVMGKIKDTDNSIISYLYPEYLRKDISVIPGLSTIVGKVQSFIITNEEYEVFSILPDIKSVLILADKEQRENIQKQMTTFNFSDKIIGPAILISPLAVYR